ncbi:cobalamin 5'-phosphate synthase [Anaerobacillus alkalilacustris]|uniref:Adenosylcobinamide-GDP ribazoletransferase n=1 Tax=Anaerobacillus alkalilacustris TaxID=393763 RepID=A0A1S2LMQ6_9BACI|nr:adenosylcobinamide-GDP ribazoletransferase [Anaerobacillus alkalilacustris]OIJ13614.1 cobalamin 5'-phosphate synthase [Anaerobacillus alkalilacustris]
MKQFIYGFLLAVQFLSRLPIPVACPWNKETSKWALRNYPVVGLLIGTIISLVTIFLQSYLPLAILVLLVLTLWVWLTGGLHLDGWMDVADAIGSNAPLEKKWIIMKDPHVGSFGILALVFLLAWKATLLYFLLDISYQFIYVCMIIIAFSRFSAVSLLFFLPTAKKEGLAWEWKSNLSGLDIFIAVLPMCAAFVFFPSYFFVLPTYVLFIALYGVWVRQVFKGINGDLLGTAIEGGELWGLAIAWIYFSFVMV